MPTALLRHCAQRQRIRELQRDGPRKRPSSMRRRHWRQPRRGCRGHISQYFGWGDVNGNIPPILLRTFGYSRPILVALRSLSLKPISFGYKTPPIRFSQEGGQSAHKARPPSLELALTPLVVVEIKPQTNVASLRAKARTPQLRAIPTNRFTTSVCSVCSANKHVCTMSTSLRGRRRVRYLTGRQYRRIGKRQLTAYHIII